MAGFSHVTRPRVLPLMGAAPTPKLVNLPPVHVKIHPDEFHLPPPRGGFGIAVDEKEIPDLTKILPLKGSEIEGTAVAHPVVDFIQTLGGLIERDGAPGFSTGKAFEIQVSEPYRMLPIGRGTIGPRSGVLFLKVVPINVTPFNRPDISLIQKVYGAEIGPGKMVPIGPKYGLVLESKTLKHQILEPSQVPRWAREAILPEETAQALDEIDRVAGGIALTTDPTSEVAKHVATAEGRMIGILEWTDP